MVGREIKRLVCPASWRPAADPILSVMTSRLLLPLIAAALSACGDFYPDPVGPGVPGNPDGPQRLIPFRIGAADHQEGRAIVSDGDGGAFVVSWFTGTVDFDQSTESVSRTSWGGQDIAVARYGPTGEFLWVTEIGGVAIEVANAAAATPDGGVVVVGHSNGTGTRCEGVQLTGHGERDILIAKLSRAGACMWAHQVGGIGADEARGVAVAPDGTISVVGLFNATVDFDPGPGTGTLLSRGGSDGFVVRYAADGTFLDVAQIGGADNDQLNAVTVTGDGSVVVGGEFRSSVTVGSQGAPLVLVSQGGADAVIACYTPFMGLLWAQKIGGAGEDRVTAVAVDGTGRILAGGSFEGALDLDPGPGAVGVISRGGSDIFVAGYSAGDGSYSGLGVAVGADGSEGVNAIVADASGFVIGGWFQGTVDFDPGPGTGFAVGRGTGGAGDAYLAAYGSDGAFRWVTPVGAVTTGGQITMTAGIALDADGIWATGRFFGVADFDPGTESVSLVSAGDADIWVARYGRSTGELLVTLAED